MKESIPVAIYVKEFLPLSQTFVYRQLKGVAPEFKPAVICKFRNNEDIYPYEEVIHRNDPLESSLFQFLRVIKGYNDSASIFNYIFWKNVLKKKKCRMIHAHFGPNGITIAPLAEALGIPLIVTFHGYCISKLTRNKSYLAKLKKLFNKAALIITASEKFRKDAVELGCPLEKTVTHYIGVPVEQFKFRERVLSPNMPVIFLQVSNFVEKKGHVYTLQAFKKVLDANYNCRLRFVGDGETKANCKRLCGELGIADYVEFLGSRPMNEIPQIMDEADVFVHHSVTASDGNTEATTLTIAEAMSSGMPVLSTWHGGIPEEVEDGKSGFLVEERDVDAYAAKWIELLSNPSLITEMGIFNRKRTEENFNLVKQNKKLKEIYRTVLEKHGQAGKIEPLNAKK